ncbi:MAG TPA: DEAD/DEAH box helicase family protein, partial [Ktedonobacterales bacterium]|nr:DEAD/DEAH box helicase family protein [Ktedonobacterales bacterium]
MVTDTTQWQATPPPLNGMRRVTPLPLPSREYHPPCVTSTFERRYPLADYLRKRHRGLFRSLICDEAHQFKGAGTAQGFAAASLVDACNPGGSTLFLTGTLFSGYCSDLYPMLWRLLPELRATFGYGDLKRWVDLYGVRQKVLKIREGRPGRREDGAKSKRREDKPLIKELPGISPLVLRHLLDSCLFLELADVAP